MELLYKRLPIQSKHTDHKEEWVMIVRGRQRRKPYDDCYLLQHEYSFMIQGVELKIDGYVKNSGFDCNYKKEWKTYNGVLRYIENKIGSVVL